MESLEPASIVSTSQFCLVLLRAIIESSSRKQHENPAETNTTVFLLWARSIGALVTGEANADRRLRDFPDIKRTILDLLTALQISLQRIFHQEQAKISGPLDLAMLEIESDAQTTIADQPLRAVPGSNDQNWQDVERNLEYLTRIAIAIRTAGTGFRNARAERFRGVDTLEFYHETLAALKAIEYVGIFKKAGSSNESLVSESPGPSSLHARIAECNVRRRRRFNYAKSRHKTREEEAESHSEAVVDQPVQPRQRIVSDEPQPEIKEDDSDVFVPPALSQLSQNSTAITPLDRNEYKTPVKDVDTSSQPEFFREGSFIASKFDAQYPPCPRVFPGAQHVECNICYELLTLPPRDTKKWWSKHVKSDLRPYVCLMSNCAVPYETFHTTKEWLKHMVKEHRDNIVQWICRASKHATKVCQSEQEFVEHMETEHPKSFTKAQLPALLKRCGVPAPQMFAACPLCSWFPTSENLGDSEFHTSVNSGNSSGSPTQPRTDTELEASRLKMRIRMERHIADHLLSIALMSLLSRENTFTTQSIQSVTTSTASGSRASAVSDLDDYFRDSDAPATEYDIQIIPDCDPPNWDKIYMQLSKENRLQLRHSCGPVIQTPMKSLARVTTFVERRIIFRQIVANMNRSPNLHGTKWVALVGPRGIGKTELAKKYVQRSRKHKGQRQYIIWLRGDNEDTFRRAFLEIAQEYWICIDREEATEVVIIDAIKDWLRDPVRGEWLIVVDGLGKVANKMEEYIRNFIPNCDHGHVIITARHGNATDHLNARIDIGPMTDDESMNFLETVLQEDGSFDEQEEINKYSAVLTKLCRGVPLFLDLSCKAMKQSKISCKEFCEKADPLDNINHSTRINTLSELERYFVSQHKYHEAEVICRELVHLGQTSFRENDPRTLGYLSNLADLLSIQGYVPQAAELFEELYERCTLVLGSKHIETLKALRSLASLYGKLGKLEEAEKSCVTLLRTLEDLGTEDLDRLLIMKNLVTIYQAQGKLSKAEEVCSVLVKERRKFVGDEDQETLWAMSNLGLIYQKQNRFSKAQKFYEQVLRLEKGVYGVEHSETLQTMTDLCSVYQAQDKLADAEKLCRKVLEARNRSLGKDHPQTLEVITTLANILHHQHRWAESLPLHQQALEGSKKVFGDGHVRTLAAASHVTAYSTTKLLDEHSKSQEKQMQEIEKETQEIIRPIGLSSALNKSLSDERAKSSVGEDIDGPYNVIIAIDFGTAFCSVGYTYASEPGQRILIKTWPGSQTESERVPTTILYDEDDATKYRWGYDLEDEEHKHEWFKLGLYPQILQSSLAKSYPIHTALGSDYGSECERLATDYIRKLVAHVKRDIENRMDEYFFKFENIAYIIAVPASWSEKAQNKLRTCVENAGIEKKNDVELITEAEAVGLYAVETMKESVLKVKDTFVLCDAGAVTVDLISYTVEKLGNTPLIVEAAAGSGGLCGSTFLNRIFDKYLRDRFMNYSVWDNEYHQDALSRFEVKIKREFTGDLSKSFFLPARGLPNNANLGIKSSSVEISGMTLHEIFEPVVTEILSLINAQIQTMKKTNKSVCAVILAGGLARNHYLTRRIKEEFATINVIQLEDCESAVVQGALIRALDKQMFYVAPRISARMSRTNYGILTYESFDENFHEITKREVDLLTGEYRVAVMKWLIRKGDIIHESNFTRFAFYWDQKVSDGRPDTFDVTLYKADDEQNTGPPRYLDDGVKRFVKLRADFSSIPEHELYVELGKDGQAYYKLDFEIEVTFKSASLECRIVYKGKRYVTVESEFL